MLGARRGDRGTARRGPRLSERALSKAYLVLAAQFVVTDFVATFEQFPPRQKAASFTIDQALEKMAEAASGH